MNQALLLTGATGFIGSHLLWTWLQKTESDIYVLARGRRDAAPRDRIIRALLQFYRPAELAGLDRRLHILSGDVTQKRLGLDRLTWWQLRGRLTHIIHCAAAARFDLEVAEARRNNVRGAQNILSLASECRKLQRLDYVGTAYVAGNREGRIREEESDAGQEFRNSYEQSKLEAEVKVREAMNELPIAIQRPSIVICDSRTGRASNHNGFYRALRAYLTGKLTALPGHADSLLDLVPVNYVTEAMFRIAHNPASIGRCYHLAAGAAHQVTLGNIRHMSAEISGHDPFAIVPPEDYLSRMAQMAPHMDEKAVKLAEEVRVYMPYLNCRMWFETTNTVRDTGLEPPPLASYFTRFVTRIQEEIQEAPALSVA
jgi:thioester reductase-like protein